jgi:uncharacterized protein YijF (DUF1287 family)
MRHIILALVALAAFGCARDVGALRREPQANRSPATAAVVESAIAQAGVTRLYDPSYVRIAYPGGDVPEDRGVCTDVVVRAFRRAGVDLQKEVHEDMRSNFGAYPKRWGLKRPDPNIDHRRVPNLQTFFARRGKSVPVSARAEDYRPGDVVTWTLESGLPHTGLVTDAVAAPGRYAIAHNIGAGVQIEDVLFAWPVTGHYRYFP